MAALLVFHGSEQEMRDLVAATARSCEGEDACRPGEGARPAHTCSAHAALLDQRFLDGVLWARRAVNVLLAEEFNIRAQP